jgi:hypothetical protein
VRLVENRKDGFTLLRIAIDSTVEKRRVGAGEIRSRSTIVVGVFVGEEELSSREGLAESLHLPARGDGGEGELDIECGVSARRKGVSTVPRKMRGGGNARCGSERVMKTKSDLKLLNIRHCSLKPPPLSSSSHPDAIASQDGRTLLSETGDLKVEENATTGEADVFHVVRVDVDSVEREERRAGDERKGRVEGTERGD